MGNPKDKRVRLGEHQPEDIVSTNGLRRYFGVWGPWSGLAPDNSALFVSLREHA